MLSLAVLSGCGGDEGLEPDPALVELEVWRAVQTEQECPEVPQDAAAKELVRSAQQSGSVTNVYGEDDPYDRVISILEHLWTRQNPSGEGVVVTAVRDGDGGGLNTASRKRHRAVWLVLDDRIYPLNVEAAGTHGVLSSGLPPEIAQRSGLSENAIDTESEVGVEEFISFRWHGSADPLPVCE